MIKKTGFERDSGKEHYCMGVKLNTFDATQSLCTFKDVWCLDLVWNLQFWVKICRTVLLVLHIVFYALLSSDSCECDGRINTVQVSEALNTLCVCVCVCVCSLHFDCFQGILINKC